ncbi:MAG: hypothetical protein JWN30_2757, partial [Bacilli bacterium]|nr:hypothetical protein [Bacilli bacterium]
YLDRHDLFKAKKYFRRSVELEPSNPIHHCNLAGVLSELGAYEESNDILNHVINELDASLAEVFFYMANNYANLGEYDSAEEYIVRYLEAEPEGEFTSDAEEMLEILIEDFGGGKIYQEWQTNHPDENSPHEISRRLLEEGKFVEATEQLQSIIQHEPDSLSPRNNLSLAYYYLGNLDQAMSIADDVLAKDPDNIHARCNMAVFYQHLGKQEELNELLAGLAKIYPLQYDHSFKLATTMGILGRHDCACRLFKQLTKWSDDDPAVWHAYAASLCNQKKYDAAAKVWKRVAQLTDDASISDFYLNSIREANLTGIPMEPVSYQYHIPFYEQFKQLKDQLESQKVANPWLDPLVKSSLLWALRHGDIETKTQVIQTISLLDDEDAKQALHEFVLNPGEMDQLKQLALVVLRRLGEEGHVSAHIGGKLTKVRMGSVPKDAMLECQPNWGQVLLAAQEKLSQYGSVPDALPRETWLDFLERSLNMPPRIYQVDCWAAGLSYVVLHQLDMAVTQTEIASWFGVSKSTVSRTSRHIAQMLEKR